MGYFSYSISRSILKASYNAKNLIGRSQRIPAVRPPPTIKENYFYGIISDHWEQDLKVVCNNFSHSVDLWDLPSCCLAV